MPDDHGLVLLMAFQNHVADSLRHSPDIGFGKVVPDDGAPTARSEFDFLSVIDILFLHIILHSAVQAAAQISHEIHYTPADSSQPG